MDSIQRITYATDFSPSSLAAFSHALQLARVTGAELTLLHVLPALTPFVDLGYVPQQTWSEFDATMRAKASQEMNGLVRRAADAGVRATPSILGPGLPADEIVLAAQAAKTDVLVLGTHGRTGVARLLLGSVAARVVATASCPVLTVRAAETVAAAA
jgi:nucleotide-binding universal stress UspA family protein